MSTNCCKRLAREVSGPSTKREGQVITVSHLGLADNILCAVKETDIAEYEGTGFSSSGRTYKQEEQVMEAIPAN